MSITLERIREELFYFRAEAYTTNVWALVGIKLVESEMFGYDYNVWLNWGGAKRKLSILVSQSDHEANLWQNTKFLPFPTYCLPIEDELKINSMVTTGPIFVPDLIHILPLNNYTDICFFLNIEMSLLF